VPLLSDTAKLLYLFQCSHRYIKRATSPTDYIRIAISNIFAHYYYFCHYFTTELVLLSLYFQWIDENVMKNAVNVCSYGNSNKENIGNEGWHANILVGRLFLHNFDVLYNFHVFTSEKGIKLFGNSMRWRLHESQINKGCFRYFQKAYFR
jgi:hypothetical protein